MEKTIITLFTILFFTACNQQAPNSAYELSPREALQRSTSSDYILTRDAASEWMSANPDNYILVDLRAAIDAEQNPLAGSVQIPVADLLDESNTERLRSKEHILLVSENLSQSNKVWLLLTQLNFDNVKVIDAWDELAGSGSPEQARYDFAAVFQKAKERHAAELEAGKPKPVVEKAPAPAAAPKPKKKVVEEEEEGC